MGSGGGSTPFAEAGKSSTRHDDFTWTSGALSGFHVRTPIRGGKYCLHAAASLCTRSITPLVYIDAHPSCTYFVHHRGNQRLYLAVWVGDYAGACGTDYSFSGAPPAHHLSVDRVRTMVFFLVLPEKEGSPVSRTYSARETKEKEWS